MPIPSCRDEIRGFLESEMEARIADLHLWRLGPGHQGLIVSLVSPRRDQRRSRQGRACAGAIPTCRM